MKKSICLILIIVMLFSFAACGESHTHSFGEWEIVENPTCTEDGKKERVCDCGEKQTNPIPNKGHTVEKIDAVKETCTTDGSTMSTYCTACGEIIEKPQTIPASHKYDDGKITTDATCTAEGEKIFTCSVCNVIKTEVIEKAAHSYETKITKDATCAKEGEKTHTCSACGDKKTEVIEKIAHKYTEKVTKDATCDTAGTKTYTCSVCNDKFTESILALGHKWENATCTTAKKCSTCGKTEGKALGHKFVDKKCSVCGEDQKYNIKLPSTPLVVKDDSNKFKFTNISIKYFNNYLDILYSGEKIAGDDSRWVQWKLYDSDGVVIDSGSELIDISVGDKLKDEILASVYFSELDYNETYILKILDY